MLEHGAMRIQILEYLRDGHYEVLGFAMDDFESEFFVHLKDTVSYDNKGFYVMFSLGYGSWDKEKVLKHANDWRVGRWDQTVEMKQKILYLFGGPAVKQCTCGAKHTSNPNCHSHWCDINH